MWKILRMLILEYYIEISDIHKIVTKLELYSFIVLLIDLFIDSFLFINRCTVRWYCRLLESNG